MRILFKKTAAMLLATSVLIFSYVIYYNQTLPEYFLSDTGEEISLATSVPINCQGNEYFDTEQVSTSQNKLTRSLKLFGIIPIKDVAVSTQSPAYLVPCGTPFGIKMYTEGVVVVGMSEIQTDTELVCPAKNAGLKIGDVILSVNGEKVSSNEKVSNLFKTSAGKVQKLTVSRKGKTYKLELTPVKSAIDGKYKVGVWVRDSSAGIGTVTFFNPADNSFGGLGHPICDVDTGEIMPLGKGEIVDVEIVKAIRGEQGTPGELSGNFMSDRAIGYIDRNNDNGVFGVLNKTPTECEAMPIAFNHEVECGNAQIISTIEGTTPKQYNVEIEKINYSSKAKSKNMIVKITSSELIEKTGGIVQGMSGSPIIQNGRLVGAVTHVFVNDPTRAYGIFIENMLD